MIDHLRRHGHRPVKPTVRMLRHWWGRINKEVFDGALLPCQLSAASCSDESAVGLCYPLDGGRVRIVVHDMDVTRAGVLGTLAHEMIHQWQHQNGLPMNHGIDFQAWKETCAAYLLEV